MLRKSHHFLNTINKIKGKTNDLNWLDYGCGNGECIDLIGKHFNRAVGFEPSCGMLNQAQKRNPDIEFYNEISQLAQYSYIFDVCSLFGVLHHVGDLKSIHDIFDTVRKSLKTDGIFCIMEFNPLNPACRIIVNTCIVDNGVHLEGFSKGKFPTTLFYWQIESLLREANFRHISTEFILIFPYWLKFFNRLEPLFLKFPIGTLSVTFCQK
jgi:SAM-dependent methyltransferase